MARRGMTGWILKTGIVALLVAGAWVMDDDLALTANYRGTLMARFDWWRGHREIKLYGLPSPNRPRFVSVLNESYKVQANVVASCIVSRSLVAYVGAYNLVVSSRLKDQYGRDVIAEVARETEEPTSESQ